MVRIKRIEGGVYIDRDTGEVVPPSVWGPIVENARKAAAQRGQAHKTPKEKKVRIKKVGDKQYIDRDTGRKLEDGEWMPIVSRQRAYGNLRNSKLNIKASINTTSKRYGIDQAELKRRYVKFIIDADRYPGKKNKFGQYIIDFGEYMYEGQDHQGNKI